MNYLYAAYIATWVIHIGYLLWMTRGYSRLRDEMKDFQRD